VYNDDDNCLKIGFPNGKNQKRNECLGELLYPRLDLDLEANPSITIK
jgi:hypothetical protein